MAKKEMIKQYKYLHENNKKKISFQNNMLDVCGQTLCIRF